MSEQAGRRRSRSGERSGSHRSVRIRGIPESNSDINGLDDDLVAMAISFCHFDAITAVGRTCRRMHRLSSAFLDEFMPERRDNDLDLERPEDILFFHEQVPDDNESGVKVTIREGWTDRFSSMRGLEEAAIGICEGSISSNGNIEFDVDRARHLLRTTGQVNYENFLPPEEGRHDGCFRNIFESGFDTAIKHTTVARDDAAAFLTGRVIQELRGEHPNGDPDIHIPDISEFFSSGKHNDDSGDNNNDSRRTPDDDLPEMTREVHVFRHLLLCLLRKAESPITRSKLRVDYHAPDYGQGSVHVVYSFRLTGSHRTNIEIRYLQFDGSLPDISA